MRAFLLAAWLAIAGACAVSSAGAAELPVQLDSLMALARTYGVVRYFHPSDSLDKVDWNRFLVHAADRMGSVTEPRQIGPRLEELFAPIVEGFRVAAPGAAGIDPQGEGPRVEWRHLGYGVEDQQGPYVSWRTHHDPLHGKKASPGFFQNQARAEAAVNEQPVMRLAVAPALEAHIAISLPMSATQVGEAQQARLRELAAAIEAARGAGDTASRAQAQADGIALWNVARHFFPYGSVAKVDWEKALRQWLAAQPASQTRAELNMSLRRLAAPLDDGHVRVVDPLDKSEARFLPISVRPAGAQWVVDATLVPGVEVGDVMVAVDGKPTAQWYADRVAFQSGSEQFKRWRVRGEFLRGRAGQAAVKLRLARGNRMVELAAQYESPQPVGASRHPPLQEIRPGIFYLDLGRFRKADFDKALPALAAARGIVFDLRGYPSLEAIEVVPYWITGVDSAQWMRVPRFDKPFAEPTSGWSFGWQRERDAALEKPKKVLLADARTVSYSESLAAYFPGQKTGPVIGEATAGANGDVALATLPSGLIFGFSGLVVTRHDGTLPFREGIRPDVTVVPTPEGIRAGKDEVLERALAGF
jgi:Peptidase family S41